jgi:tetratricopeptide (TPR) repeat protein
VDARTDIFAIGVVSFELLTYEEAFQGDSFTAVTHRIINEDVRRVSDLVPDAPADLCAIVQTCLQKNSADRFKDAESLRIALSRVRRRIEHTSDFDASSAQTIVTPIKAPVRAIGTGMSLKPAPVSTRTAELTPPPDPVTEGEALARARHAKIQGALQRTEACLQNGEFDRALAAIREVLDIEPAHAGALALQQKITTAVAKQQAAALLADARVELQRGALTRCKTLLEEARQLDPATHDAGLERSLRLARVEEERKRHRTETVNRTVAVARAALDRQDLEAALALAREALSLDPNITEARDIELTALHGLEDGDGSQPTLSASNDVGTQETTVVALPPPINPPVDQTLGERRTEEDRRGQVLEGETTVVALPWRTPTSSSIPVTAAPAPQGVPPLPPVLPPVLPSPATGEPAPAAMAPRTVPIPAPAPRPVVSAPAAASTSGPAATAGTPAKPVSHAPAAPAKASSATSTPPAPSPFATFVRRIRALPVQAWIETAQSSASQVSAKARALPRAQLLMVAGIVALLLVVVAFLALAPAKPGTASGGRVVIEALPWATVTAIRRADGKNHLATPTVTPLWLSLPSGKYTVTLAGPSGPSETRTITIDVLAGGVTVTPATRFTAPTAEEYFNKYLGADTPAPSNSGDAPTIAPGGTPAPPTSQAPSAAGATP